MTEFWFISAPGEKTCQETWNRFNNATAKQNDLSTNYKFAIPDLKIGTLDMLFGLSDDLGKLDICCESVTRNIAQYMGDVLEDPHKLRENLLVNNVDMVTYMTTFQWDLAKYPIKQSLRNIADIMSKEMSQIEDGLGTKSQAYNNLRGKLQSLEPKSTGDLLTRNLGDIVRKEDFVLDSEYLQTLIVVVPKLYHLDWQNKYESLTDMIVPRSSRILFEDDENCLCTVTLFRRVVDEFKHKCKENKFVVRDFEYNEEELAAGKTELSKHEAAKKKMFGHLVKWLKVNFGESFTAWIHVKALRIFVESVLRFGLPVNFQAMLVQPHKNVKRLREVLNQLYSHLDSTAMSSADVGFVDIPGLDLKNEEYYPYVYYKINLDLA